MTEMYKDIDLSKRGFLRVLVLLASQLLFACVNRRVEPARPVTLPMLATPPVFLTQWEGQTLIGEEEIQIEWEPMDSFPFSIQFSSDAGTSWIELATLVDNQPFLWLVPQIQSDQSSLKLVTSKGETRSSPFQIRPSQPLLLNRHAELEQVGGYVQLDLPNQEPVIVKNTGDGFSCISLVCTHSGCTTSFSGTGFNCSCHGSRFDGQGAVLNGPAARPLKKYLTKYVAEKKKLLVYEA